MGKTIGKIHPQRFIKACKHERLGQVNKAQLRMARKDIIKIDV